MRLQILSLVLGLNLVSFSALAGVSVYTGIAGEKVYIEVGDKDGAFIKIEGLKSPWTGKVFKTNKTSVSGGDRYTFDYQIELSTGSITRSYTPIVSDGQTLVKGTVVPKIKLYVPGGTKDGASLNWSEDLTKSAKTMSLQSQFKKSPFSPEVD